MGNKYTIGLDFGTLSARAVLVDVSNGEIKAYSLVGYQDAVIETYLPGTDVKLPPDYALQNPENYMAALESLLYDVWRKAKIDADDVVGIGVGFTTSTVLTVDSEYVPLCMNPEFRRNPHSWAKLWKHHGAQEEADILNHIGNIRQDPFFKRCGSRVDSEYLFAKVLETYRQAPDVFDNTYKFIEAADWIVYLLCGQERRNSCTAGYRGLWNKATGYPPEEFFAAIDPKLHNLVEEKLDLNVYPVGERAGFLTEEMAKKTGLSRNVAIAVAMADGELAVPAAGVMGEHQAVLVMGTSLSFFVLNKAEVCFPGLCGVVEDGILPGYFGYDAGQPAVGDIYDWFVNKIMPHDCYQQAVNKDVTVFDVLNEKASKLKPGQSGLLALDWWNGNRSVLANADLSGMIIGLKLTTTSQEIYRALIESTAFGLHVIFDAFEKEGFAADEIFVCGGLARKSPTVMQIFADVLGKELKVYEVAQMTALGAAIFGAVAADVSQGGYEDIFAAIKNMSAKKQRVYAPNAEHHAIYGVLYEHYKTLSKYLGEDRKDIMKVLKDISKQAQ